MFDNKRQSNIELLRIFLMLGVIILHYNGVGGALYSAQGINYLIVICFESLCICAVDLFMLISGYFSCTSTKTIVQKPVKLILQVILTSIVFYSISSIINDSFSLKSFIGKFIPSNYFVILYVTVYLLTPYLNLLYEKMDRKMILVMFSCFSFYPTLVEVLKQLTNKSFDGLSSISLGGSQAGYTIVNFILMYFVGMYIRKEIDSLSKVKKWKLIITFGISYILIIVWSLLAKKLSLPVNSGWE